MDDRVRNITEKLGFIRKSPLVLFSRAIAKFFFYGIYLAAIWDHDTNDWKVMQRE